MFGMDSFFCSFIKDSFVVAFLCAYIIDKRIEKQKKIIKLRFCYAPFVIIWKKLIGGQTYDNKIQN